MEALLGNIPAAGKEEKKEVKKEVKEDVKGTEGEGKKRKRNKKKKQADEEVKTEAGPIDA